MAASVVMAAIEGGAGGGDLWHILREAGHVLREEWHATKEFAREMTNDDD